MRLNDEAGLTIFYLSPKSNCLKSQGQAVLYESDFECFLPEIAFQAARYLLAESSI